MFSQKVEIFQAAHELSWFFRNNSLHVGPCDRRVTGMVPWQSSTRPPSSSFWSGLWDNGEGGQDSPAGEGDESDEDLQVGPTLCWTPESHLHPESGIWARLLLLSCQLSLTPVLLGLQGAGVAHVAGGGRCPHVCLSSLLRREGLQMRREIFFRIIICFTRIILLDPGPS